MMQSFLELDARITTMINTLSVNYSYLRRFLFLITHTTGGTTNILYAVILFLFFKDTGHDILALGLAAFAFQVPVYFLFKNMIKRERPYIDLDIKLFINPPDRYSFPSGHSASAILTTLIVSSKIPELFPYLLAWVLCIFVSRVSLGIHYVTDVAFGAILGGVSYQMSHIILSYVL